VKRPRAFAAGAAVLACAWLLPLGNFIPGPFSAHMTMHMAVVAIAAPLIAAGIAGTRLDPALRAPWLVSAIPASMLELCAVWAWHAPALHHAAREDAVARAAEQATFAIAGLALWCAALGGGATLRRARAPEGVAALLFTSMHMTLLGALIALTPRALYEHAPVLCGVAIAPVLDQQIGGAIMLFVGSAAYLAGGVWLIGEALRDRAATSGGPA
jgi:putative membrane protein